MSIAALNVPGRPIQGLVVHTELMDGRMVCIRAMKPDDEALLRTGITNLSTHSRYLRFFSVQPMPPDRVIDKLLAVDGHRHIGWGAIHSGDEQPIGAVHVVRPHEQSISGEFSVAIVDAFHHLGLARMLTAVIMKHSLIEGVTSLDVQVLSENRAALNLIRSLGGERCGSEFSVTEYTLDVANALDRLQAGADFQGLKDVLRELAAYR